MQEISDTQSNSPEKESGKQAKTAAKNSSKEKFVEETGKPNLLSWILEPNEWLLEEESETVQRTILTEPPEETEEPVVKKSSGIPNAPRTNFYGAIKYDSSGR